MESNLIIIVCVSIVCLVQFGFQILPRNEVIVRYQLKRRVQHMTTGLLILFLRNTYSFELYIVGVMIGTILMVAVSTLRNHSVIIDKLFLKCFSDVLRFDEIERKRYPGAMFFMIGVLTNEACGYLLQFPAHLGLVAVTLGDPAAGLVSSMIVTPNIPFIKNKTWAGFIACTIVCYIFLYVMGEQYALQLGINAAIAESYVFIDDNMENFFDDPALLWALVLGTIICSLYFFLNSRNPQEVDIRQKREKLLQHLPLNSEPENIPDETVIKMRPIGFGTVGSDTHDLPSYRPPRHASSGRGG